MDPVLSSVLWASLLSMVVGAALGILLAAAGRRRRQDKETSKAYLTSFQYVLSDDPDSAIEELTRVAAVTPETIETYFALGSVFRRKGDLARAIRIHQNIILRPGLDAAVKRAAGYALGLDYRRAGLLNRAVETLEKLAAEDPGHKETQRELRELYEVAADWERAIAAQERLTALGSASPSIVAHLHAARARQLLAQGSAEAAERASSTALAADPGSADALAARGEILLARGLGPEAIAAFSTAIRLDPEILSQVFPRLEEAFQGEAYAGLGVFLGERLREAPEDPLLRLALARHLRKRGLAPEAAGELRRLLLRHPRLLEARQELGQILLQAGTADEVKAELALLLQDLSQPQRPFACRRCQVELAEHSFRCPRCFSWDAVVRLEEPRVSAPVPVAG